jgi:hypothetical protein
MRRPRSTAGHVVEQSAHGPHHSGVDPIAVTVYPELLLRSSHAHEQDVGPVLGDVLDHALGVGSPDVEVAVVGAPHVEPRVPAPKLLGRVGSRAGLRSEQVERPTGVLAHRGHCPDPVGPGHPVGHRQAHQLGGKPHAVAVAVHEVRALQGSAQVGVGEGLVEHVGVHVAHPVAAAVVAEREDATQQIRRWGGLHVDVEQLGGFVYRQGGCRAHRVSVKDAQAGGSSP